MEQVPERELDGRTDARATSAHLRYWLLLIAAGGVWGITFSLNKIAVAGGAHPVGLNFWLSLLGFV
ncbi:MAG: hypothetical protein ACR2O4_05895, partial [Hyphomicrobiaceae bacterium]